MRKEIVIKPIFCWLTIGFGAFENPNKKNDWEPAVFGIELFGIFRHYIKLTK